MRSLVSLDMRLVLALVILACAAMPAEAERPALRSSIAWFHPRLAVRGALPLHSSIFVSGCAEGIQPRWIHGAGRFTKTQLPRREPYLCGFTRVDVDADGDAELALYDQSYTFSGRARTTAPRVVEAVRFGAHSYAPIGIWVDTPVAAIRATLTRAEHVDEIWIAGTYDVATIAPSAEPSLPSGTLSLTFVLADGSEVAFADTFVVEDLQVVRNHEPLPSCLVTVDGEPPRCEVDLGQVAGEAPYLVWLAALLFGALALFVRPEVALHGAHVRHGRARLRLRIRLPHARVLRRRA